MSSGTALIRVRGMVYVRIAAGCCKPVKCHGGECQTARNVVWRLSTCWKPSFTKSVTWHNEKWWFDASNSSPDFIVPCRERSFLTRQANTYSSYPLQQSPLPSSSRLRSSRIVPLAGLPAQSSNHVNNILLLPLRALRWSPHSFGTVSETELNYCLGTWCLTSERSSDWSLQT